MNKKICFLVFILLISCSKKQDQGDLPMNGEYFTIDLDGEKENSIPFSTYFKSVRTIVLEANEECLIGDFNELQVFDGYLFLLDKRKANSLFVFDMEGNFVRKIGKIGSGPGEYMKVFDFTLDKEKKHIFLLDRPNRIHKYAFDGTYLFTLSLPIEENNLTFIQHYDGLIYATTIAWRSSKDDYLLLKIDPDDGRILSKSLSIKYDKGWNETFFSFQGRFFRAPMNNPPRYNQMFMDYIVSLGEEITPYIKLKSRNLTTTKDIESFRGKDGVRMNFDKIGESSKIHGMHHYIENENYVYFKLIGNRRPFVVIFDKKTKETKLAERLYNDLIFKNHSNLMSGCFTFSDSMGAYEVLDTQSGRFGEFLNALSMNEMVPDLDRIDQLKQLDSESNPVIFFYEYK